MYVHVPTCMYMYIHTTYILCMYMYLHVCTCTYMYVHKYIGKYYKLDTNDDVHIYSIIPSK